MILFSVCVVGISLIFFGSLMLLTQYENSTPSHYFAVLLVVIGTFSTVVGSLSYYKMKRGMTVNIDGRIEKRQVLRFIIGFSILSLIYAISGMANIDTSSIFFILFMFVAFVFFLTYVWKDRSV